MKRSFFRRFSAILVTVSIGLTTLSACATVAAIPTSVTPIATAATGETAITTLEPTASQVVAPTTSAVAIVEQDAGEELVKGSQEYLEGDIWARTELFFGSGKPDGSSVTDAEFRQFVDEQITPLFPDGLTLLTGYGQYRNSNGEITKEQSYELILLYSLDSTDANRNIEVIREAYKTKFQQESVLRVDSISGVSF